MRSIRFFRVSNTRVNNIAFEAKNFYVEQKIIRSSSSTSTALTRYPIGSAMQLSSMMLRADLTQSFRSKIRLLHPLSDAVYPYFQRELEIKRGKTPVKESKNLEPIYMSLSKTLGQKTFFTYSDAIPAISLDAAELFFKNQFQYKQYIGRAPIVNGSYYLGTSRRGGVLGDIFIDLDSKEFDSSKLKLEELKSYGLPRSEIISKFVEFFRNNILDNSTSECLRLKKSHEISKAAGIMPLSAIIFLGYADCRPHAIAISALLNHIGINCEYANFVETMQSKDKRGNWEASYSFDHSVAIYTGEDEKQYIADSYFPEFNNLTLESLMNGIQNKEGTKKYRFIHKNQFPTMFVKNPTIHYDNIAYSLRVFGEKGGITLRPHVYPMPKHFIFPQAIKDLGTVWDLKKFERGNSPVKIGMSPNKDAFSTPNGIRILDMPIRLRGGSVEYKIPYEIKIFQETIQAIINHAHTVLPKQDMKESNTYLTIDQTWVEKGTTQRKPGIHTDGFQGSNMFKATINHGYIVSNHIPTAFYTDPFYFNGLDYRVHNYNFEMDRQSVSMQPILTEEFGIYFINAYTPHAAMIANKSGYRTFLRVIYDKDKYNRYGNSINRLFDYKWKMIPNTNLSRTFRYIPPSQQETKLISEVCFCMRRNQEPHPGIIDEIIHFFEVLKTKNIQEYYNFIYRIFTLDSVQLSNVLLCKLETQALSDYSLIKLLFIPLESKSKYVKQQSEDIIYKIFQQKIIEGKKDEISGLIYEITNDPRYNINKEKFNALLILVSPRFI